MRQSQRFCTGRRRQARGGAAARHATGPRQSARERDRGSCAFPAKANWRRAAPDATTARRLLARRAVGGARRPRKRRRRRSATAALDDARASRLLLSRRLLDSFTHGPRRPRRPARPPEGIPACGAPSSRVRGVTERQGRVRAERRARADGRRKRSSRSCRMQDLVVLFSFLKTMEDVGRLKIT